MIFDITFLAVILAIGLVVWVVGSTITIANQLAPRPPQRSNVVPIHPRRLYDWERERWE